MQLRPRLACLLAASALLLLLSSCSGTTSAPTRPDIESAIDADVNDAPAFSEIKYRSKPDPTASQEFVTLVVPGATAQQAKDALAAWSLNSIRQYTWAQVVTSAESTDAVCTLEAANTVRVARILMQQDELVRWTCLDAS